MREGPASATDSEAVTMRTRCVYAILIKILMVFCDSHAKLRKFCWWLVAGGRGVEIFEICGIVYGP